MIREIPTYQAICDGCGEIYKYKNVGEKLLAAWLRESYLSNGWKEVNGKLYCPNCIEYDNEIDGYKPKEKK